MVSRGCRVIRDPAKPPTVSLRHSGSPKELHTRRVVPVKSITCRAKRWKAICYRSTRIVEVFDLPSTAIPGVAGLELVGFAFFGKALV